MDGRFAHGYKVAAIDDFSYTDPTNGITTANQVHVWCVVWDVTCLRACALFSPTARASSSASAARAAGVCHVMPPRFNICSGATVRLYVDSYISDPAQLLGESKVHAFHSLYGHNDWHRTC